VFHSPAKEPGFGFLRCLLGLLLKHLPFLFNNNEKTKKKKKKGKKEMEFSFLKYSVRKDFKT
jgi:hypothetical protein